MSAVDKAALFAPRLPEEDFEIPGVGTIRIRALTREEALGLRDRDLTVAQVELALLQAAMVAPALTGEEIVRWQKASPAGELEPVTAAILRMSGMAKSAPKEAMKSFRE